MCMWGLCSCCVGLGSFSHEVGHHVHLDFLERQYYLVENCMRCWVAGASLAGVTWWVSCCELASLSMKSRPASSKRPPVSMMTGITLPLIKMSLAAFLRRVLDAPPPVPMLAYVHVYVLEYVHVCRMLLEYVYTCTRVGIAICLSVLHARHTIV